MKVITFFCAISFCTSCLFVSAQPQWRFQNFGTRDGLSHFQVNSLLIDKRGYRGIGTEFGLNRFDGVVFEKWYHHPDDSTSLINNNIGNITEDLQEHLWLATEKGVSIYHIKTGKFKSFSDIETKNGGKIILQQPTVYCDRDGDIWIGSARGSVILYKSATHEFFNIPVLLAPQGRMQNKFITGFLQDRKNRIWVSTSYGIYLMDKHNLKAVSYRIAETNKYGQVLNGCTNFFETHEGLLLCGTWNAGFLIFDEQRNVFKPFYSAEGPFLPNESVFNFGQYNQTVFFNTGSGLYFCLEKDLLSDRFKGFVHYMRDPNDPFALASSTANIILKDATGNLWIGGDRGLSLLNKNNNQYKVYSYNGISKFGNEAPRSIEQNDNQLVIGVSSEVVIFDLQAERFKQDKPVLSPIGFHRIIKRGNNYYQPSQTGMAVYDLNFKLLRTYTEKAPDGSRLNIYNAMPDHEGNLWIVTSRFGLRKHEVAGEVVPFLQDSTKTINSVGYLIGDIAESNAGNLYAGGKNLFILKNGNDFFSSRSILSEKSTNEIRALKIRDSILWIGSRNGLFSYNENNGRIAYHNLPSDINQTIEELDMDLSGNIWMITSSGLVRFNPSDSTTMVFNERNGWPTTFSALKSLDDGRIAAGTIGEIILIDPGGIQPEMYSPDPYVTQVLIDEKKAFLMPGPDTTFRLRHHQSIRFNYVSPTYHNPGNTKYAWQLKGMDDQWHNTGNATSQPFASLSPGHYTFSVRSVNASNIRSDSMTSIHFMVMPPFYRTPWFIMLIAAIIGGVIYAFYRYRLQKALQIERMRTRIATDLHDDIGATLSSISFYSEAVHQKTKNKLPEVSMILEKMGETSRNMVSSMSDIVWAINPQNDDMGKMLYRMQSYARDLSAVKEKDIQLIIDEKAHHLKLQLEQRRNIYLIFKEALTNALKYSESKQIRIAVKLKGNLFHLQIADDGKGFNLSGEGEGNGLKNMQRRAEDIGARIQINTAKNKGTVIDLELII